MGKKKRNGNKLSAEKVLLVTAIVKLIQALVELVDRLIE